LAIVQGYLSLSEPIQQFGVEVVEKNQNPSIFLAPMGHLE